MQQRNRFAGLLTAIFASLWLSPLMAHDMTDIARDRMAEGGFLNVMWTGAEHMLSGYDHLLFLLGVMFFLTRLREIFLFVTAFTLGHTITLIFATFAGITANHYLIDAVIAVTVAYKGFENLDGFRRWFGFNAPNLLLMVFIFGLIHGFGLSARLQAVTLADDPALLGKILIFNLGVEVGQIIALVIMAAVIRAWQPLRQWSLISRICNSALIVCGLALLVFQLNGYWEEQQQYRRPTLEVFTDIDQVMGRVVAPQQQPDMNLADLPVLVINNQGQIAQQVRTDADGWFTFTADVEQSYTLQVELPQNDPLQSPLQMGQAADAHEHDEGLHIPFYVFIAALMLLSLIPARRFATSA